jgi:hypothetical protein
MDMRHLMKIVEAGDPWRDGMRVALETMRVLSDANGSFTLDELASEIGNHLDFAPRQARRIADHMLDRFDNMLDRQDDGYRLRATPGSMQGPMSMLRQLANRPQYVTERRLDEADIVPFPMRHTSPSPDRASEVVPFPAQKRAEAVAEDRQRYTLMVASAAPQAPGKRPRMKVVDTLDHLNAEEVAAQLGNYHPVKRKGSVWMSAPMDGVRYYMLVTVGEDAPSEPELEAIAQHMESA